MDDRSMGKGRSNGSSRLRTSLFLLSVEWPKNLVRPGWESYDAKGSVGNFDAFVLHLITDM